VISRKRSTLAVSQGLWFHHGGDPVQYGEDALQWSNMTYPGRWIVHGRPIAWLPQSLNLTWGHLEQVYVVPPRTIEDLMTGLKVDVTEVHANMLKRVQENDVQCTVLCLKMDWGAYNYCNYGTNKLQIILKSIS
jgi:hypothetical protein